MTPAQMLQELELLSHNARIGRVIELGLQASAGTNAASIIATWERGEYYERWLSLYSCFGSRDGEHVLRAFADPSSLIRGLAWKLSAFLCDDVQLQSGLALVPTRQQAIVLRKLYKRRRLTPIDTFLHTLAAQGEMTRLSSFLGFGSAPVVTQYIEQAFQYTSISDLRRLANLHPDILLPLLQTQVEASNELDPGLIWRINAVLPIFSETRPDEMLALVTALSRHTPLSRLWLQPLLAERPNELVDLLLGMGDRVYLNFSPFIEKLDLEHILRLMARPERMLPQPEWWLQYIPVEQRGIIYERYSRGWYNAEECLPLDLVSALPRERRYQEARRHMLLPALATRPQQRLPYAAYLLWDEALATLTPFIKNPDPELRALALRTLMGVVRFHREKLADALTMVHARKNEQDPVRGAMLIGLADLPPGAWKSEHLESLAQIIAEGLDAADLSSMTVYAMGKLIFLLLPLYPNWGASQLVALTQQHGRLSGHNIEQRLSDADVQRLSPALLPVLQGWRDRERYGEILAIASSLGRRLSVFDGLVDILRFIVETSRWSAESALSYIALHKYELLQTLVPELIARDKSWGTRHQVYTYLHRHRQDLITPFLGQEAYSGWFSTGLTRFVLPLTTGFHRWTPEQQRIFARTLTSITFDTKRDNPALFFVMNQLSALPAIPPTRLIELASDERLAIRDTALRALGRLDDKGRGVPTLLDSLNDDRARIAIYVLRRTLLEMPEQQALALLQEVPMQRVTVAKEVIRLLGELSSEAAYRLLLGMYRREDLHRDARIALLRGLWTHLEDGETWSIMEGAAQSADPTIAKSVARIPSDRLSLNAQQRLLGVLALLLQHDDPEVRIAALTRCLALTITDSEKVLFAGILMALNSRLPDEQERAAQALFATYTGKYASTIGQTITTLLPRRIALQNTVLYLQAALLTSERLHLPTVYVVLDVLRQDVLATRLSILIAVAALPIEELIAYFTHLAAENTLHAGLLAYACTQIEGPRARTNSADLARLEGALRASSDERLRRLAFAALLSLARTAQGWTQEYLNLQQQYRNDPSPLVAEIALFTASPLDNTSP
jgi:hypothetical protein